MCAERRRQLKCSTTPVAARNRAALYESANERQMRSRILAKRIGARANGSNLALEQRLTVFTSSPRGARSAQHQERARRFRKRRQRKVDVIVEVVHLVVH